MITYFLITTLIIYMNACLRNCSNSNHRAQSWLRIVLCYRMLTESLLRNHLNLMHSLRLSTHWIRDPMHLKCYWFLLDRSWLQWYWYQYNNDHGLWRLFKPAWRVRSRHTDFIDHPNDSNISRNFAADCVGVAVGWVESADRYDLGNPGGDQSNLNSQHQFL